jgi:hypothetical protein
MGSYMLPAGLQAAAVPAAAATSRHEEDLEEGDHGHFLSLPGLRRFWPRATKVMVPAPGAGGDNQQLLRVVQLLVPALVGRAKVFGNTLVLRPDMVCEDMPYFDGPGTDVAPLGLEGNEASLRMPEVGQGGRCTLGIAYAKRG